MKEKRFTSIVVILGTRAQLIKMAPLLQRFQRRKIHYILILTGQHKETIDALLKEFSIEEEPIRLHDNSEVSSIMKAPFWLISTTLGLLRVLREIFPNIHNNQRRCVIIHGDTFSTLIGAIAGKFRNIDIIHVEAGLRSPKLFDPFPEEIIRRLVSRLSDIAFCPGEWAFSNMGNYKAKRINTKANTIIDTVTYSLMTSGTSHQPETSEKYLVVSIHRFENLFRRRRLERIMDFLDYASLKFRLVFVLHPATHKRLHTTGLLERLRSNSNITLRKRMIYTDFMKLLNRASGVISDGGSNQEELSHLGIPTYLMRSTTERQEGIGTTTVVGNFDKTIFRTFLSKASRYTPNREHLELPENSPSDIIASWITYRYIPQKAK